MLREAENDDFVAGRLRLVVVLVHVLTEKRYFPINNLSNAILIGVYFTCRSRRHSSPMNTLGCAAGGGLCRAYRVDFRADKICGTQ